MADGTYDEGYKDVALRCIMTNGSGLVDQSYIPKATALVVELEAVEGRSAFDSGRLDACKDFLISQEGITS